MDPHEQLNREAARMVGMIESILDHEREMRKLPKAESEYESDSKNELLDIPEVMTDLRVQSTPESDDANEDGECTGDPYCHCNVCRACWNDVQDDRAYDERKEPASDSH